MLSTSVRKSVSRLSSALIFFILVGISLALWWRPLTSALVLALRDAQYTHILLILPVSAALIFLDWKSPETSTVLSSRFGRVLLALAAAVAVVARGGVIPLHPDEQLSVSMLALVVFWIGAFILCFGIGAFRRTGREAGLRTLLLYRAAAIRRAVRLGKRNSAPAGRVSGRRPGRWHRHSQDRAAGPELDE